MFNFAISRKTERVIPNLIVAERVIQHMKIAANAHMADETGEAMIGLVLNSAQSNGVSTIYILDTIAPDESAIREYAMFQQGDEHQEDLRYWLYENWHVARKKQKGGLFTRGKWDAPLAYLGDWHKQPGFMIQPSGADLMTALGWLDDLDQDNPFLIAPIVTVGHPYTVLGSSIESNYVVTPMGDGEALRVDFWYIDARSRVFIPISPTVYPNDQLPELAPYPWHLLNEPRLKAETDLFTKHGLFHALTLYDTDGDLPLEICFLTARVGAEYMYIVVTPHDYPRSPPRIRKAPFISMGEGDDIYKVFEQAWKSSAAVDLPDFHWSEVRFLIDIVQAADAKFGHVIAKPATDPAPAGDSAPVESKGSAS
jgi:hypothetical protein